MRRAAAWHGGRIAMIGILPTLHPEELQLAAISDAARYQALNNGLRRLRQEPFQIRIDGADPLEVAADDVGLEGANTFLPAPPTRRPRPVHRPLQRRPAGHRPGVGRRGTPPPSSATDSGGDPGGAVQAGGRRPRRRRPVQPPGLRVAFGTGWTTAGALELLEESVRLHEPILPVVGPEHPLDQLEGRGARPGGAAPAPEHGVALEPGHLRLDGGHVRIELRALPAGPTVADMCANAAFALATYLFLAADTDTWVRRVAFQQAHHNFYRRPAGPATAGLAAGGRRPGGDDPGGPADPAATRSPTRGCRTPGWTPRRPGRRWP